MADFTPPPLDSIENDKFVPPSLDSVESFTPPSVESVGERVIDDPSVTSITARTTGYHAVSPESPEFRMEGGNQDKMGNPLHTLDAFYRGQVPWVGMAGDPRIPYGTSATSPQFPGVPFRIVDTGSAFKNAGLSHFDIARDTAEGANADENNRHVQFDIGSPNFALAQGGEATDQAAPPSVAPQPQLQTAAPGVDIGVTPPTPQPTAETQPTPAQPLNLKDPKVLDDLAKRYADAAMGAASQQLVNIPRAELQQNQGIVRKTLGAAYNTAAGFIDGSTSEMGFNMLLNPLAGVVGMAAAVPDLINQVREADKTPPGSPERFQAGANVTGFLAIPAVLHAISKAPTIYKQLTKGGIDASTSSTQRAPGIETPHSSKEDKDNKESSQEEKEQEARKAAHDKVPKPEEKTEANKDRWESIDKANKDLEAQHELIEKAPLIMPSQNPPPGYPRVEVLP